MWQAGAAERREVGTGCLLSLPSLGGIYELLRSQPLTGAGSCEFIILTAGSKLCGARAMMDEARGCLRSMLSRRAAQWEHQPKPKWPPGHSTQAPPCCLIQTFALNSAPASLSLDPAIQNAALRAWASARSHYLHKIARDSQAASVHPALPARFLP